MKENNEYRFLDYTIIQCANNDGIVLSKPKGRLWEHHLGNYSTVQEAEAAAIIYFMIARPKEFSTQVFHRVHGTQTYYDYFKLKMVCVKEHIKLPESITASKDLNFTINYKGTPQ